MPYRHESEKDFMLKAEMRAVLWSQGYSTRLDVLLAYEKNTQGKSGAGKAGITDLDVLGIRLDPGFRVHTAIADCKTVTGQVPERLFWLSGVGKFFGADTNFLVRSRPLPEHAPPLARSLDINLVGPDDLAILANTYVNPSGQQMLPIWQSFFSPALLGETLEKLSRLPSSLNKVERYRETFYWMDETHKQLNQILVALQQMAKDGSSGPTFYLVFADFVWLYVITLWRTCQALNANGFSKIEQGLQLYINGYEAGTQRLQRWKQTFEALARQIQKDINLPLLPSYFRGLLEVVARCIRRPNATAKMARRAEWAVIGQIVGNLGLPPWTLTDDDLIGSKLLGDVARFLVQASGLKKSFLDFYLDLIQDWSIEPQNDDLEPQNDDLETLNIDLEPLDTEQLQDEEQPHPTDVSEVEERD